MGAETVPGGETVEGMAIYAGLGDIVLNTVGKPQTPIVNPASPTSPVKPVK